MSGSTARFGQWLGVVLGGVAMGVVAVIYHAAFPPFGTGVVVALVAGYLAGLRLIAANRWPALLGMLAVFTVIGLLAGSDNQGSVLVMADRAGLSFLGFVTLSAVVVIAWPKFSSRPTSYDGDVDPAERTLTQ
jgi:hypothetical protein